MILGYGLFINLSPLSSWAKIILYQIVAGFGVGPNFQAPLIALQSGLQPRDIGTATATFGFTRLLASAISVVIGGVIFQNELARRGVRTTGTEGPLADVGAIAHAPTDKIEELRAHYADSLQMMWILYVCTAGVGLIIALLIRNKALSKVHEEAKVGLAAQEEDRMNSK